MHSHERLLVVTIIKTYLESVTSSCVFSIQLLESYNDD